jgi:predicted porin
VIFSLKASKHFREVLMHFLNLGVFMKKSLIALAVLAASGASFAQSTVTIYGTIDTAVASIKSGDVTTTKLVTNGVSTSVYGFKGTEDLGGGLKANFKLENSFAVDTGASATAGSAFSREAWVGLSGGFGELRLGKVSSAYNDPEGAAAPALGSLALSPLFTVFQSDWQENTRPKNTIYYATPAFGGVTGSVSYSLNEKTTAATSDGEVVSLGLQYEAGPLYVGAGYQSQKAYQGDLAAELSQLNVTYDLTVAKLLFAAGHVSNSNNAVGSASEWSIGADIPVAANIVLSTGYGSSKTTGSAADFKHTAFALDGAYVFSKRTLVYAGFESDTNTPVGGSDLKTTIVAVGVKHTF